MTNATALFPALAPAEVEEARMLLQRAHDGVRSAVEDLSEAQWNYRPAADAWSIAGILEHIVIVEELVLGRVSESLVESDEHAGTDDTRIIDDIARNHLNDRSRRFPAPEIVHPTGRWAPRESLDRLSNSTTRLIERLETAPGLRQRRAPSPPLKALSNGAYQSMDGYQWIVGAAQHTDRHRQQILEVKASPEFPQA